MKIYLLPTELNSIKIFPDIYENDDTVFYHGTSELYSHQIENFGLFPNHKPLTQHFYSLYKIADKVFTFTQDNNTDFGSFNTAFRDAFEYFKDFTRISFSAISLSAAYYSIGAMAGGQGLRHLLNIKTELNKLDFSLLANSVINISEAEKHFYETVDQEINNIKNSNGVVYAFKFNFQDLNKLSYDQHVYHSVLLSIDHVPPSKIVAKVVIPNTSIIQQDLIKEANNKTLELSYPMKSNDFIRKIISNNLERIDSSDFFIK
jgi:hypothetical protein